MQLEISLRYVLGWQIALDEGGYQRGLAGAEGGGELRLGVMACCAQGCGKRGAVFRQETDGTVASGNIERLADGLYQTGIRVKQRHGIVDFQPVALGVLGTDSEGKAQHEGSRSGRGWRGSGFQVVIVAVAIAQAYFGAGIEQRPLEQRGVGHEQCPRLVGIDILPIFLGKVAPGGAASIEHFQHRHALQDVFKQRGGKAVVAQVVEGVGDTLSVQGLARLAAGVAVLDSVEGRHRYSFNYYREALPRPQTGCRFTASRRALQSNAGAGAAGARSRSAPRPSCR